MLRAFKPASSVMSVWDRAVDAAARMVTRKTAERRGERSVCMASISLDLLEDIKERLRLYRGCLQSTLSGSFARKSSALSPFTRSRNCCTFSAKTRFVCSSARFRSSSAARRRS